MLATEFHAEIKHFKDCELFGILQNPWATSETRQPGPLHRSKSCNSKKHRPVWSLNLGYTTFVAKFALKSGKFAVLIQPSVDGGRIVSCSFSGVTAEAKNQKQCSMQSCFHLQLYMLLCWESDNTHPTWPSCGNLPVIKHVCKHDNIQHIQHYCQQDMHFSPTHYFISVLGSSASCTSNLCRCTGPASMFFSIYFSNFKFQWPLRCLF